MQPARQDFQDTYATDFQSSWQPEPDTLPPVQPVALTQRLRPSGSFLAFLRDLAIFRFN